MKNKGFTLIELLAVIYSSSKTINSKKEFNY